MSALPGVAGELDLKALHRSVAGFATAAARLAGINRKLMAERQWLLPEGIPGRSWFKHSLYAPTSTYAAMELPGVREAVDQGDWTRARRQVGRLVERVNAVSAVLGR